MVTLHAHENVVGPSCARPRVFPRPRARAPLPPPPRHVVGPVRCVGAALTDPDHTSKTDVGSIEGTTWALSSAKARHGVAQLMDDDLNTLWQYVAQLTRRSEGSQPHTVTIHFPKRTKVTVRMAHSHSTSLSTSTAAATTHIPPRKSSSRPAPIPTTSSRSATGTCCMLTQRLRRAPGMVPLCSGQTRSRRARGAVGHVSSRAHRGVCAAGVHPKQPPQRKRYPHPRHEGVWTPGTRHDAYCAAGLVQGARRAPRPAGDAHRGVPAASRTRRFRPRCGPA